MIIECQFGWIIEFGNSKICIKNLSIEKHTSTIGSRYNFDAQNHSNWHCNYINLNATTHDKRTL